MVCFVSGHVKAADVSVVRVGQGGRPRELLLIRNDTIINKKERMLLIRNDTIINNYFSVNE